MQLSAMDYIPSSQADSLPSFFFLFVTNPLQYSSQNTAHFFYTYCLDKAVFGLSDRSLKSSESDK